MNNYQTLAIVGAQWGDEGKGKLTDFASENADMVVRYQGGNNAGHTIVIDNIKYKLSLIPSGVLRPNVKNVLANGMVINPKSFLEELAILKKQGITNNNLFVSDRAHIILDLHKNLDAVREIAKGKNSIGTTKKGIGPAYEDKYSRVGIRVGEFIQPALFLTKLKALVKEKNILFAAYNCELLDANSIYDEYKPLIEQIKPFVTDTSLLIDNAIVGGKKVLFEGAQGVLLCIDHGTYPMVTSSSPTAAAIPLYCGIKPAYINKVLGIVKAYTTRVGGGPFPTEIEGPLADLIRERGNEYGTVTKRPRRIGWLDAVALRYAKRVSGITDIALTLLDVLSGVPEIKICVDYKINNKIIATMPSDNSLLSKVEPVYITMPGWSENITQASCFNDLPINAQNYLNKVKELTNLELSVFSVGPERKQTVIMKKLFS